MCLAVLVSGGLVLRRLVSSSIAFLSFLHFVSIPFLFKNYSLLIDSTNFYFLLEVLENDNFV